MESEYLEAYLAGELDETGRRQVEHALQHDSRLRESFVVQAQIHSALRVLLVAESKADGKEFEQGVMARLRSEGAGDRGFAKSILLEIVEEREGKPPLRWPDLIKAGLISAAAAIGMLLLFQSIIFREGTDPAGESDRSTPAYSARIERSDNALWATGSQNLIREDGWISPGLIRLESGSALIVFNSGATALIVGPADLSIESGNRMFLKSGRLTGDVPESATGFTVNTPRLNAVDLGTRFGVSVEGDGTSELHVMEGAVEVSRASGNSVATVLREGLAVRADNRTRSELKPVAYGGDAFQLRLGTPSLSRPALCYTFDESFGAIIEDSGSDEINDVPLVASGELDRSPRRAAGRTGGGLVFQPGETLDVPLSRDFRLDEPHTISFWLKLPPKVGRNDQELLLEYGREGLSWKVSCNLETDRGTRGALRIETGGGWVVGGTDLADGNWHHVAYRYLGGGDLASHLHLFVDGKNETLSHSRSGNIPKGRAGNLRIGGGPTHGLHGWIDELSLYREAVSTSTLQWVSQGAD